MPIQNETISFDDLYKGVSHQLRTILVGTVSVIIGILTLYVFPLPRFGKEEDGIFISILDELPSSQVQLIILSNILGILLTYFYFSMVDEISQKGALILHNLVLANIIIASIIIEIQYFSTFSLFVYLGVTMFSIKLRPADTRNDFITKSIVITHAATLLIWYIKLGAEHLFNTFEPVSTQIILLIATVLYCRNEQRRPLLNLPLLLNVLLVPLIMLNEYSIGGVFLLRDDISLLLFGLIMVINVVLAILYRETTYSKYVIISSTTLLFAEYVVLNIFRSSIFDISHLDILGISITQISIWYLVLVGSILLIWFTSNHSFTNIVTGSIFLLTILFTLTLDFYNGIIAIPQLFLIIGIFCTSVILLLKFSEKELYIPILQAFGIYLLSTIPKDAYSENLQTFSIIGFMVISVFTWFRHQKIERISEIIMGSFGGLVILYVLSWNYNFFNQVHYLLLVTLVLSSGIITLFVNNKKQVIIGLIIQAICLFFITLLERDEIFSGFDWLDFGIIVFIVELILLSVKYKSDTYVMKFNASVPVFLFISIILRLYLRNYSLPNEIVLGVLIILPTILLYISNIDNSIRNYTVVLQGVGIAFFTSVNQTIGPINLISFLYLAFILLSLVVWYIKKFDNLFVVYLALISSVLQIFFVVRSGDPSRIPGIIEMGLAIIVITSLLNWVKDDDHSRLILISQAISLFFISFLERKVIISGFDWLDLGLMLFILELILLSLKYKSVTSAITLNASVPVLLSISIILRSYLGNYTLPREIVLGLLIITPTILLFISNIDDKKRNYIVALQGVGIAFFTSVNQTIGPINLISFLYLAFILLSLVVWYIKKFDNLFVVYLAWISSVLLIFFVLRSGDLTRIPGIVEMGVAVILISTLLKWVKDDEYSRMIVISQSLAVFVLGFLGDQVLISNDSLSKASSSIIDFSHISHIPWVSLILIIFGIIVSVFWIRSNSEGYNFTPLILMGLFSMINLGSYNQNFNQTIPFFLALMILFVSANLIKREDKYHLHVVVLAAINILLMLLNSNQVRILTNSINLGIISVVYLFFSVLLMYQWRKKEEDKAVPIILVVAVLTLILSIFSTNLDIAVPLEFLVMVALSLSLVALYSESAKYIKFSTMMQALIVGILLLRENDLKHLITIGDSIRGYLAASAVLFVGFILLTLFVLKNADEFNDWLMIMGSYLLVIVVSTLKIYTIHPVIIGISIILLSYLSFANSFHYVKELVPGIQGLGIILLLVNEVMISGKTAVYTSIFFPVFTIAALVVWYLKGKDMQLMYSYVTIFVLGLVLTLFSLDRSDLLIHEFSILFSLLFATGVLIAFYSRLTTLEPMWFIRILIIANITLAVVSRSFQSHFDASYSVILRFALDWLIFVPLMVETAIYIKRYITTTMQSEGRSKASDYLIIALQLSLTIAALVMGSTGILSLKLLAIALVFWVFATVFIRTYLAWGTSINTVFTLAFLIAQLGEGSSDYVLYFIVMAIVGFLMVGAALINEKKFIGEPLTSSMLITGSILTTISIFAPLMFSSDQFINFLPNIVWAIQGLGIFIIAMRMDKEIWRKLALSILFVDIIKTGYDIFSQSNELIRIIGSMVLGVVLIFIFLQFTKEEETNVEIVQKEVED